VRFRDKKSEIKNQCLNNTGEILEINNNVKVKIPLLEGKSLRPSFVPVLSELSNMMIKAAVNQIHIF